MTEYDYLCICKCFQRLEVKNSNELITLENTYQTFRRFDEYDYLTLLEAKIYSNVLKEIEQDILKTLDFLLRYNKEPRG